MKLLFKTAGVPPRRGLSTPPGMPAAVPPGVPPRPALQGPPTRKAAFNTQKQLKYP